MFRFSFESLFPGTISGTTYCICQGSHKGQTEETHGGEFVKWIIHGSMDSM